MARFLALHDTLFDRVEHAGAWLYPLVARAVFAATLLVYYWHAGLTKLGDGVLGLFRPSVGACAQIFPRQMEAAMYDISQLSAWHWLVALAGTWAELLLPALIVLGLATRLAAVGMIGFVVIQSLVDVRGHGMTDADTLGAWFDRFPDAAILDQRLFWLFLLGYLVLRGGGALSLDAALRRRRAGAPG